MTRYQNFQLLILLLVVVTISSCKEDDITEANSLPDKNSFSLIGSTSIDGLDTLSIYQDKIVVNLNYSLDSLTTLNNTKGKFKVNFISTLLITDNGSGSNLNNRTTVNARKITISLKERLRPSRDYQIEITFEVTNDIETESYTEILEFSTYNLPGFYRKMIKSSSFDETEDLNILQSPFFEFELSPNETIEYSGIEISSEIDFELKSSSGETVTINYITKDLKTYLFESEKYLLLPDTYELSVKQRFKEEIDNEWIVTDSLSETFNFEIINYEDEIIKELFPSNQSSIFRNQSFVVEFADENLSNALFEEISFELDEVNLFSSQNNYSLEKFSDGEIVRLRSSDNFEENEELQLDLVVKIKLKNDSIEYTYPVPIESISNTYNVSSGFGAPITRADFSAAYPIPRQRNFLIDEFDKGGFQFSTMVGIEEYFNNSKDYEVLFIKDNDTLKTNANWNDADLSLLFELPIGLEVYSIYNYQIIEKDNYSLLFSDHFKTSRYKTFNEKMSFESTSTRTGSAVIRDGGDLPSGYNMLLTLEPEETFGFHECYATNSLIRIESILEETEWYKQNIDSILYRFYDDLPFEITYRSKNSYGGIPPVNSFYWVSYGLPTLKDSEISLDTPDEFDLSLRIVGLRSQLDRVVKGDFNDLKTKALNYQGEVNDYVERLRESEYVSVEKGFYPLLIKYHIPIYNEVSSSIERSMYKSF